MQEYMLSRHDIDNQALIDPLHYAMASRDADIMRLVQGALDGGRARLAFQPIVTAAHEPKVAFYEGLVRLLDDVGRVIPASHFMPLIEQTTLGRQIDCVMLDLAIKTLIARSDIRVSVNLSARSVGDGEWRRTLDRGLAGQPNLGARLIFEISETSAMLLHENVIRFMMEMQPKGVAFALDGFGGGVTAFRFLKDFLFDMVKIDQSFVRGINEDPDNQVLTEALITVAHQFEMFAVANGVETKEEADLLIRLGVDCLQGYHFGGPKFDM